MMDFDEIEDLAQLDGTPAVGFGHPRLDSYRAGRAPTLCTRCTPVFDSAVERHPAIMNVIVFR